MDRNSFEALVQASLDQLCSSMVDAPAIKRRSKKGGIKNIRYGAKDKLLGQAVERLASASRSKKLIAPPNPDLVPPCF